MITKLCRRCLGTGWVARRGKPVIYCNATILEHLDRQTRTAPNRFLTTKEDVFGEEIMHFRGIPIYETDGIVNTESLVS